VKPSFVVDCSVAMAWCFLDEATPATKRVLDLTVSESALVPAWWYLEVTNVLVVAERKGRIDATKVAEFISLVQSFDIEVDTQGPERAFDHLLPLCRTHGLTSYDAVYLDLAARRQLPLATLDEPLRKAAKKLGVKLLGK
jgi:predicted nucleic acid-binding protein